jgi:histidyl-tRNA synthetase
MELPRGMKDYENEEFSKVQFIKENFLEVSEIFGFKLMEPSAIEFLKTLGIKSGEQARDHVFWWENKDRKLGDIGLRFDFTIGISRYVAGQRSIKLPAKISSVGGVWRYDEPQKARFRYFNQWDIEIFGKLNLEHDAEVIEFTSKFFKKINLKNVEIDISHRKLAESYIHKIFETEDAKTTADILRAVDKIAKKSKQEILSEYKEKGYSSEKLEKIIQFSETTGTPESIEAEWGTNTLDGWNEIKVVFESLRYRNVKNIRINFGIVRGLAYYSGIVFEVFDTTYREIGALAGGGRYDTLPALFGRDDLGATGVAGGIDRIRLALENQKSEFGTSRQRISVLYVNGEMRNTAITLASELRDEGYCIDIDLNDKPLKKQMEQSVDSKFTIIVAPREIDSGMYILRNMTERSEKQFSKDDLFAELEKINS